MPKIFQYLNYIIRFYSNEHLPIHVHVQIQDREIKVEFQFSGGSLTLLYKKVKGKPSLTEAEAKEVSFFLKSYYKKIIDKWQTVFIYHQKIKCEVINKRLNKIS